MSKAVDLGVRLSTRQQSAGFNRSKPPAPRPDPEGDRTTILGPSSFVIGGVLELTRSEQTVSTLNHLGYPAYFALILGTWKLLGAIVITLSRLPRLKEWAYAGFFFDLTAAAASRAAMGDNAADIVAPLVFLALVLTSWALRPASRTLAATTVRQRASTARVQDAFIATPVRI